MSILKKMSQASVCAFLLAGVSATSVHAQALDPAEAGPTGEITKNPSIRTESPPSYPPLALEKRMEAVVVLDLTIAEDGMMDAVSVQTVTITTEAGEPYVSAVEVEDEFGFAKAALIAGNSLEFNPAEVDGTPVSVQVSYTYRFTLPEVVAPTVVPDTAPPPPRVEDAKPAVINFEGAFVERGTRSEVAAVKITVYKGEGEQAEGYEAVSDDKGRFAFYDLAPGKWTILAEKTGYLPYKTTEMVVDGKVTTTKYYFERGSYNEYDVTIEAERPRKEVSRRSLRGADIEKIPGTLGDPVLVIENLPGVARTLGGDIIVRGSGPTDTRVFIDGTAVPLIYHFGGLKSVFPAKIIESIDFYPGNFSAAYGRGMGGVFDLHLKRLNPDRFHGSIDVSVLDTSVYFEAPITDTLAMGIAGRRSYVDFVLDAVIPDDASIGLISAPRYYDYQFFGNWRPAPAHDIRWLFLGSDDLFELLFDDPARAANAGATSNELSLGTAFQRITGDYRYTPNAQLKNHLKLSAGQDLVNFNVLGFLGAEFNIKSLTMRDTLSYRFNSHVSIDVGLDTEFINSTGTVKLPPPPREGEQTPNMPPDNVLETKFESDNLLFVAPYIEGEIQVAGFTFVPGLRMDYFGLSDSYSVDPRMVVRYDGPSWAVKGGAAVVHQAPDFPDIDEVFGNPDLDLQRAYQYSVGGEWSPLDYIKADVTLFYKDMRNLVTSSDRVIERNGEMVPEKLANDGVGRVYGAEVFLEHTFANNMRGWISYTLSRAERRDRAGEDYRLFDYDQTHILAVVASYILPRNWELGLRWRLVSGNLDTPVVGSVFDNDQDAYTPIYGAVNSGRLPTFHQLDLRVDKTWVFNEWKLSAYLSLINSYNRGNPEAVNYNYDYSEKNYTTGLPILPILGVKGDW